MKQFTQEEILHNKKVYDDYHKRFKMVDGWHPGDKYANFAYLMRLVEFTGIPLSGTSCLDIGCGTGDLSAYLRKRGIKKYLGIDVYAPSIKQAKEKYPNETFILSDFLSVKTRKKFDYAFCSGALTIKLPNLNNYSFLEATITKMWKMARIGIAFNILTDDDDDQDTDLFFYSRERVEEICKRITGKNAQVISEKTPELYQIHVYLYRDTLQIR